jgi:hypothetical protein
VHATGNQNVTLLNFQKINKLNVVHYTRNAAGFSHLIRVCKQTYADIGSRHMHFQFTIEEEIMLKYVKSGKVFLLFKLC